MSKARAKWRLESHNWWNNGSGTLVETVAVFDDNDLDPWGRPHSVEVWWDGKTAHCVRCAGERSAMLTTCRHARAVKRHRPH